MPCIYTSTSFFEMITFLSLAASAVRKSALFPGLPSLVPRHGIFCARTLRPCRKIGSGHVLGLGGLCSIFFFYPLCYSNMLKIVPVMPKIMPQICLLCSKLYQLCLKLCPKFAYYAQTMPIITGRSKLVCSNNYFTLHRKSKLKQDNTSSTIEL